MLLLLVALLIGIGLIAVAAASPARPPGWRAQPPLYYFYPPARLGRARRAGDDRRLDAAQGSRAALVDLGGDRSSSCCLVAVPFVGIKVNGAVRWIGVDPIRFQPSEFLKPFFVVALAWMLSLRAAGSQPAGGPALRRWPSA